MSADPVLRVEAGNLRSGGALQVASSVISQIVGRADDADALARWPLLAGLRVAASPQVIANLPADVAADARVSTSASRWGSIRAGERCEVALTIFGPDYSRTRARRRVMGCGDVLPLLSTPKGLTRPALTERIKRSVKRALWIRQGRRCELVVESRHLKSRLLELGIPDAQVHVVPNCVHEVFAQPQEWEEPPEFTAGECDAVMVYVARAYEHKNHRFLLAVHDELRRRHGVEVRFVVTLTDDELAGLGARSRDSGLINVGPLEVAQLPLLYRACDGVIFPSLLESFSVTPLEAAATSRPLIASDRDFVRETVRGGVTYIDPLDPVKSAAVIADWLARDDKRSPAVAEPSGSISAEQRADRLLDLCHASSHGLPYDQ